MSKWVLAPHMGFTSSIAKTRNIITALRYTIVWLLTGLRTITALIGAREIR